MSDAATLAANRAIGRRVLLELWGQGKLDLADELYAPNYVDHVGRGPEPSRVSGPEGIKQAVMLFRTAFPDLTYTVEVRSTPTTAELDATAAPPKSILDEFTDMPTPPPAVVDLLRTAPQEPFTRLQFLRDALYRNVIAAGAGSQTDISPERVAEMLQPDTEANPFEITAAEAMLARWAGVPARIGCGYHRGEPEGTGFTLRPKHGAAWLEQLGGTNVAFVGLNGWALPVAVFAAGMLARPFAPLNYRLPDADLSKLLARTAPSVAIVDDDLRLTYVSPAARSMLGYEPDGLVGRAITDLIPADQLFVENEMLPSMSEALISACSGDMYSGVPMS